MNDPIVEQMTELLKTAGAEIEELRQRVSMIEQQARNADDNMVAMNTTLGVVCDRLNDSEPVIRFAEQSMREQEQALYERLTQHEFYEVAVQNLVDGDKELDITPQKIGAEIDRLVKEFHAMISSLKARPVQ